MFSALRQGSTLYILEKGQKPSLKLGTVTSVSQPKPDTTQFNPTGVFTQPMFVDISVSVDGSTMEFKKLNSANVTANDPTTGIFVSESKDNMLNEIETLYATSKSILDSVPYHESAIKEFENMRIELNPDIAKQAKIDEDLANMKHRQDDMDVKLDKILNAVMNKTI